MLVDPDGIVCRCGNRGCLETVAATSALVDCLRPTARRRLHRRRDARSPPVPATPPATRRSRTPGSALGQVVAMLLNVLNPEMLIVGGDLAAAGDLLLDGMRESVARAALPETSRGAQLVAGVLGERAQVPWRARTRGLGGRPRTPDAARLSWVNASETAPRRIAGQIHGRRCPTAAAARILVVRVRWPQTGSGGAGPARIRRGVVSGAFSATEESKAWHSDNFACSVAPRWRGPHAATHARGSSGCWLRPAPFRVPISRAGRRSRRRRCPLW